MKRRGITGLIVLGLLVVVILLGALSRAADYPAPTGPQVGGRTTLRWVDHERDEAATDDPTDRRAVVVHVWYPAQPGPAASSAPYLPDLDAIAGALQASGEVGAIELLGLRFVRPHVVADAPVAAAPAPYPVLLFSPGNATNAAFYSGLLEDLASHGYVVVAMDHPYQVTAVLLPDGRTAAYAADRAPGTQGGPIDPAAFERLYRERVEVRAADAAFVLDRLAALNGEPDGRFSGRLDLARAGAFGHSLGGVAAAELCQRGAPVRACLNLDGLVAGRPFLEASDGNGMTQPFMLLTKAATLPPTTAESPLTTALRGVGGGGTLVVIHDASHQSFSDTPTLLPTPLNGQAGAADQITGLVRDYTREFFDRALDRSGAALAAPWPARPGVTVETYGPA